MISKLAKSAISVQATLDKLQFKCQVLELPNSTRTAADAASSIGCDIAQIVKSLIFKTKKNESPILILVSGSNQVNIKQIENHVGERVVKADADFARRVTGFAIGGIPPIGHKNVIDFTYIDQELMQFDTVWAAAGTPNAVFCIKSEALLKSTGGELVNLKKVK